MLKLKKICLSVITVFFSSLGVNAHYNMNTPVEGASIANDILQFNVMKRIYENLSVKNPSCYAYSIKNTQVLHYPYDVKKKNNKYVKGYWQELWTVDVCGSYMQIPVLFYINGDKTDFKIDESFLQKL